MSNPRSMNWQSRTFWQELISMIRIEFWQKSKRLLKILSRVWRERLRLVIGLTETFKKEEREDLKMKKEEEIDRKEKRRKHPEIGEINPREEKKEEEKKEEDLEEEKKEEEEEKKEEDPEEDPQDGKREEDLEEGLAPTTDLGVTDQEDPAQVEKSTRVRSTTSHFLTTKRRKNTLSS